MISRRQFLRGDLSGSRALLRPPWALAEEAFLKACTRCVDCVSLCPEKIIVLERGYPVVDFGRGACTFCEACLRVCVVGALKKRGDEPPWRIRPQIAQRCVAYGNVVCRSCGEACLQAAIRFQPRLGGAAVPEVDGEKCTGCGACVSPCPAGAIRLA